MNNSNKQQKVYILLKDLPDHEKGTEFYWDSTRGKYKTLLETVNGAEPYSCYMGIFVENNPEWFKEKQQPIVEERIVVDYFMDANMVGYKTDNGYAFVTSKPIPKEKHEAVKQAIEIVLNNENFGGYKSFVFQDGICELPKEFENSPRCFNLKKESIPTIERQDYFNHDKINKQLDRIHYLQALGCDLISRIYHYGNFKAESNNERELEKVLNELKLFPTTEDEIVSRPPISKIQPQDIKEDKPDWRYEFGILDEALNDTPKEEQKPILFTGFNQVRCNKHDLILVTQTTTTTGIDKKPIKTEWMQCKNCSFTIPSSGQKLQ